MSFDYIEDYLEYLAGFTSSSRHYPSPISLARYDVHIVSSMAQQTLNGLGLSDRQSELAHKLVLKYRRQFSNHGISVERHETNPEYRIPIRRVDRSKTVALENHRIAIRFPYDVALIDVIREEGKKVPGELKFNKENRQWEAEITEPRVIWAYQFADKYQFNLDDSLLEVQTKIDECWKNSFAIELGTDNNQLKISNAESSLIDFINQNIGGFDKSNLLRLMDYSGILGYTVDQQLAESQNLDEITQNLLVKKENHLPWSKESNLETILNYAKLTNRYPIFVYDPLNEDKKDNPVLDRLKKYFDDVEVIAPRQRKFELENKKCVYITAWQPSWKIKIPLLLTLTGLMIGPKKQLIVQSSEKIVFCSEVIYNA